MKVLVACEFSGAVRDAFTARGHDAWSCDMLPSETPGQHYQGDARDMLEAGWDLLVCHPPCTHLAVSGARWFKDKKDEQAHGLGFVMQLWAAPIDRIALENPISILELEVAQARPDCSAMDVWPWRNQGYLSLAQGVTEAQGDAGCRGPRAAGPLHATW